MKKRKILVILLTAITAGIMAVALIGYNSIKVESKMINDYKETTLNDVSQEKWDSLAQKTIFFGHMSVGYNILDGIADILSDNTNITIKISDTQASSAFCHAQLGYNGQPLEKIASFQSQMQQIETPPDIAFLKFCYVDFYAETDTSEVFQAYQAMITQLQTAMPDTIFMHCTVPLTSKPNNPKGMLKEIIKSMLGKITTVDHNRKRMEFGDMLKQTYPPETIIDITQYESTTPQGRCYFKTKNNIRIPFLIDSYTMDGGHLNETGRKRIAEQVLIKLANDGNKS